MTELRWLLVLLGVLLLVAVYLLTRYQSRIRLPALRRASTDVPAKRLEPVIEADDDVPIAVDLDDDPEPVSVGEPESADDTSAEADAPPSPPSPPEADVRKVVAIRLVARDSRGFPGESLLLKMREAGLRHGEFGIFHRLVNEDEWSRPAFSVASLSEPGSFDLTRIKVDHYPGVSLFMVLPGPSEGVSAFEDMVDTARQLAAKLDGDLLDEHGSTLSVQRERYLREEIIQFEHQAGAA